MRRDFTYIDDIVEGIVALSEKPAARTRPGAATAPIPARVRRPTGSTTSATTTGGADADDRAPRGGARTQGGDDPAADAARRRAGHLRGYRGSDPRNRLSSATPLKLGIERFVALVPELSRPLSAPPIAEQGRDPDEDRQSRPHPAFAELADDDPQTVRLLGDCEREPPSVQSVTRIARARKLMAALRCRRADCARSGSISLRRHGSPVQSDAASSPRRTADRAAFQLPSVAGGVKRAAGC